MIIERDSFPSSWSAAGYRHELTTNEQAHYVVLEVGKGAEKRTTIGYAGQWLVAGEAHVSTIAVAPRWRNLGLGALLLTWIIDHALAHDAFVVRLEVREQNERAQSLYRSYGFTVVGRRRGYYRDTGEDALLMDLELSGPHERDILRAKRRSLWRRLRRASLPE
jgi:ribosomal-protein-alanine N-acetyltransferase